MNRLSKTAAILALSLVGASAYAATGAATACNKDNPCADSFVVVNQSGKVLYGQEGVFNHKFLVHANDNYRKQMYSGFIRDLRLGKNAENGGAPTDRVCVNVIQMEYYNNITVTVNPDFSCEVR